MSVVLTRRGTPHPGKRTQALQAAVKYTETLNSTYKIQAQLHVRFGGPAGQILMISHHKNVQELEDLKRRIIEDTKTGKLHFDPTDAFESVDDAVWLARD